MRRLYLVAALVFLATPAAAQSPCATMTSPAAIIACEQERAGGPEAMHESKPDHAQVTLTVLRQSAASLNAAGIPGGPWGVLVKTSGANCKGYSCDIICTGNGSTQKQWDVFVGVHETSRPTWNGPLPTITVRPCEFVAGHTPPTPIPDPTPVPAPTPAPDLSDILARLSALERELAAVQRDTADIRNVIRAETNDIRAILKTLPSAGALPLYTGKGLFGVRVISRPCNPDECK